MKTFDINNLDWEVVRISVGNKYVYAVYNTKTDKFFQTQGERYLTEYTNYAQEYADKLNANGYVTLR